MRFILAAAFCLIAAAASASLFGATLGGHGGTADAPRALSGPTH